MERKKRSRSRSDSSKSDPESPASKMLAFVAALSLGLHVFSDRAPGGAAPLPVMRFNVPPSPAVRPSSHHIHRQPGRNPRERLNAPTINPYL